MGRQLDPNSTAGKIRDLISRGKTPMEISAALSVPPARVYAVRKQSQAQQLRISKVTGKPVRKYAKQVTGVSTTKPKAPVAADGALQAQLDATRRQLEIAHANVRDSEAAREEWQREAQRTGAALNAAYARIATLESANVSTRLSWVFGGVK